MTGPGCTQPALAGADDSTVRQLAGLFRHDPVWVDAMRRIVEGAASTVYFNHLPGRGWRLVRCHGETLLLPGPADDPDFVFRFSPAAVDALGAVRGGIDDVAVTLFGLILEEDEAQGVGLRIVAPFSRLVRHGHLRLVVESGPKTILFGARHGIFTVWQLRRFVRRISSATPATWEQATDVPNPS